MTCRHTHIVTLVGYKYFSELFKKIFKLFKGCPGSPGYAMVCHMSWMCDRLYVNNNNIAHVLKFIVKSNMKTDAVSYYSHRLFNMIKLREYKI